VTTITRRRGVGRSAAGKATTRWRSVIAQYSNRGSPSALDVEIAASAARLRASLRLGLADAVQAASALAINAAALRDHDRDFLSPALAADNFLTRATTVLNPKEQGLRTPPAPRASVGEASYSAACCNGRNRRAHLHLVGVAPGDLGVGEKSPLRTWV